MAARGWRFIGFPLKISGRAKSTLQLLKEESSKSHRSMQKAIRRNCMRSSSVCGFIGKIIEHHVRGNDEGLIPHLLKLLRNQSTHRSKRFAARRIIGGRMKRSSLISLLRAVPVDAVIVGGFEVTHRQSEIR